MASSSSDDEATLNARQTTPRRVQQNATPIWKTSAQKRTPNSAPVRKTTGAKKGESLLQEFLLGRPSPARVGRGASGTRRQSLELGVKRDTKLGVVEVSKVQPPGAVKDRVKQWQKASAGAAVVVDPLAQMGIEVEVEEDEDERARIRNSHKRPGRRKSKEAEDADGGKVPAAKQRSKSAAAPKKRVISDSHWMKKGDSPALKSPVERKGAPIPKDFLTNYKTAQNPPLEKKIQDWAKRNANEEPIDEEIPSSPEEVIKKQKPPRRDRPDDTPTKKQSPKPEDTPTRKRREDGDEKPRRRMPARAALLSDDGIRVRASKSPDDGIRIRPSPEPIDDGIRIKPSRESSFNEGDDGIRVKPVQKERHPKKEDSGDARTPRKRNEKHLRPLDMSSYGGDSQQDDDETSSWTTPSRTETRAKSRRSGSPSDSFSEIPFGNSAFSVLDLPLGAEANTMRRPMPPKRNPSFVVPKVLKRVYKVGKELVNDTVDPARNISSNPPNIDAWLNGTSDPFVDQKSPTESSTPQSTLQVPDSPSSRRRSYKEDDPDEQRLMGETTPKQAGQKTPVQAPQEVDNRNELPSNRTPENRQRDRTLSTDISSPLSPSGLRRNPATRANSSPKSARKTPLKEVLLDAFRGQSVTKGIKGYATYEPSDASDESHPSPEEKYTNNDSPLKYPPVPRHRSPGIPSPPSDQDRPLPALPRRQPPTTGQHRLSTIASVETFRTSSLTETESELSQTTVTQSSIYTDPTASTLSRNSNKSGLKRRLTKHSDLISVLSLPDTAAPGKAHSIRSARSVRTNRARLDTATLQDLMRELATDETKYLRELKTLVDGVIPVLLTCVLSKSESAIAADLFNTGSSRGPDASFTKPIVDMGVALERMKSLHNRIPLEDPIALVSWLNSAHKTYDDYFSAWRMGFQDVVVNLAPADESAPPQSPTHDEMRRNALGDVVKEDGERVDVAFLLKRPLVRAKYLCKLVKGINKLRASDATGLVLKKWEDLEAKGRRRTKEEAARMVDRAANNLDVTRARDPETLALAEDVNIEQSRQVCAKDSFSLDMFHSSGQRVECEVEMILRDKPSNPTDPGDVLVCAVDDVKKWLLFPPLSKDQVSARMGDTVEVVIVMIRGKGLSWHELFLLKTDEPEAAAEWIEMLGTVPLPPAIITDDTSVITKLSTSLSVRRSGKKDDDMQIPIGERRRREAEEEASSRNRAQSTASTLLTLKESVLSESPVIKDLNDAMNKAGKMPFKSANTARARYHSPGKASLPSTPRATSPSSERRSQPGSPKLPRTSDIKLEPSSPDDYVMSGALPYIPKVRDTTPAATPALEVSMPLKESMRPDADIMKKPQRARASTTAREDGAPAPPPHRVATTPGLKRSPVIDSPTPKAKHRRTSSPLKHEYQPSNASGTSSSDEEASDDDGSFSDSSEDDELEAAELPEVQPGPGFYGKRPTPPGSLYCLPNGSLAPSNSASQAPYRGVPVQRSPNNQRKLVAAISVWDVNRWRDLHPEPCSIVVSDGLIEAFELNSSHSSSPYMGPSLEASGSSTVSEDDPSSVRPLIAQGLTPNVQIRQSTAVDIEIKSVPLATSLLKAPGGTIRYRTLMVPACLELYKHIHRARLNNPVYEQLARERMINSYGSHAYEQAVAGNRRRSWLGRTKSYRAVTRAPSSDQVSANSHSSSTFARLRRMSGNGLFNIAKSTVASATGDASQYTSGSSNSTFSGPTPPRTPTSPSLSGTTTSGGAAALGNKDLKIRLYTLVTSTSWEDKGAARLDVILPLPGQRQRSCLNNGIERRVVARMNAKKGSEEGMVVLDEVLGSGCFSRVGRTGIVVNVWEDIKGDNGEVGVIGKIGGVSGRTRKWLFQTASAAECDWVFGLCATGRGP